MAYIYRLIRSLFRPRRCSGCRFCFVAARDAKGFAPCCVNPPVVVVENGVGNSSQPYTPLDSPACRLGRK
jgi:hypothetical protein